MRVTILPFGLSLSKPYVPTGNGVIPDSPAPFGLSLSKPCVRTALSEARHQWRSPRARWAARPGLRHAQPEQGDGVGDLGIGRYARRASTGSARTGRWCQGPRNGAVRTQGFVRLSPNGAMASRILEWAVRTQGFVRLSPNGAMESGTSQWGGPPTGLRQAQPERGDGVEDLGMGGTHAGLRQAQPERGGGEVRAETGLRGRPRPAATAPAQRPRRRSCSNSPSRRHGMDRHRLHAYAAIMPIPQGDT